MQVARKNVVFNIDKACIKALEELKKRLVDAPIMIIPDWSLPYELMYDVSDFIVGAIFGLRKIRCFIPYIMRARPLMMDK